MANIMKNPTEYAQTLIRFSGGVQEAIDHLEAHIDNEGRLEGAIGTRQWAKDVLSILNGMLPPEAPAEPEGEPVVLVSDLIAGYELTRYDRYRGVSDRVESALLGVGRLALAQGMDVEELIVILKGEDGLQAADFIYYLVKPGAPLQSDLDGLMIDRHDPRLDQTFRLFLHTSDLALMSFWNNNGLRQRPWEVLQHLKDGKVIEMPSGNTFRLVIEGGPEGPDGSDEQAEDLADQADAFQARVDAVGFEQASLEAMGSDDPDLADFHENRRQRELDDEYAQGMGVVADALSLQDIEKPDAILLHDEDFRQLQRGHRAYSRSGWDAQDSAWKREAIVGLGKSLGVTAGAAA